MRILDDNEKHIIVDMYLNGENQRDIAKTIKCRTATIVDFLRQNGYEKRKRNTIKSAEKLKASRKHFFDETFFNNIDTEEKAYWLGFLYADGNIYVNHNNEITKGGTVELTLKSGDIVHLQKFLNCIGADGDYPIYDKIVKLNNKQYYANRVRLNSIDMCLDLIKFGCVPKKSLILKPPRLNQSLIRHFIRGYFDGDGCISYNKNTGIFCASIVGTLNILKYIRKYSNVLSNNIKNDAGQAYSFSISSISDIIILYRYLYENSSIYLDRKFELYTELYNYLKLKYPQIYKNTYSDDPLIKYKRGGFPVVRITDDFNEVKIYKSANYAAKSISRKNGTSILNCCKHNQVKSYGYYWLFYDEYINHEDNIKQYILNFQE